MVTKESLQAPIPLFSGVEGFLFSSFFFFYCVWTKCASVSMHLLNLLINVFGTPGYNHCIKKSNGHNILIIENTCIMK